MSEKNSNLDSAKNQPKANVSRDNLPRAKGRLVSTVRRLVFLVAIAVGGFLADGCAHAPKGGSKIDCAEMAPSIDAVKRKLFEDLGIEKGGMQTDGTVVQFGQGPTQAEAIKDAKANAEKIIGKKLDYILSTERVDNNSDTCPSGKSTMLFVTIARGEVVEPVLLRDSKKELFKKLGATKEGKQPDGSFVGLRTGVDKTDTIKEAKKAVRQLAGKKTIFVTFAVETVQLPNGKWMAVAKGAPKKAKPAVAPKPTSNPAAQGFLFEWELEKMMEAIPVNSAIGVDPFGDLGSFDQPPLFLCDDIPANYKDTLTNLPKDSNSLVFQLANLLEGDIQNRINSESDRLKKLKFIKELLAIHDKSKGKSKSKKKEDVSEETKKVVEQLKQVKDAIESGSKGNKKHWESLKKRMPKLIKAIREVVNLEARMGEKRKRCALPPKSSISITSLGFKKPEKGEIKSPTPTIYPDLPLTAIPLPYHCNRMNPKQGEGPSSVMTVRELIRRVQEHMDAANERAKKYQLAERSAGNSENSAERARFQHIARGADSLQEIFKRWNAILAELLDLQKDIDIAAQEELEMAYNQGRCGVEIPSGFDAVTEKPKLENDEKKLKELILRKWGYNKDRDQADYSHVRIETGKVGEDKMAIVGRLQGIVARWLKEPKGEGVRFRVIPIQMANGKWVVGVAGKCDPLSDGLKQALSLDKEIKEAVKNDDKAKVKEVILKKMGYKKVPQTDKVYAAFGEHDSVRSYAVDDAIGNIERSKEMQGKDLEFRRFAVQMNNGSWIACVEARPKLESESKSESKSIEKDEGDKEVAAKNALYKINELFETSSLNKLKRTAKVFSKNYGDQINKMTAEELTAKMEDWLGQHLKTGDNEGGYEVVFIVLRYLEGKTTKADRVRIKKIYGHRIR